MISIDIVVPLSGKGGVENVINQMAGYLVTQGYQLRVVQMVFEGPFWLDGGIPFYPLRREKVSDISDFEAMYRQFVERTYIPDLVIATPWPYLTLVIKKALLSLQQKNTKLIAWLHAPLEIYKRYGVGGIECLKFADRILVLNERTRKSIRSVLPEAAVSLVCNPVDFLRCHDIVRDTEEHTLLFVGRLSEEKQVCDILEALSLCETAWGLRIIGNGEQREDLERQAEQLSIADRVEFLGWKENPWDDADGVSGLILASDYEAFPLVAIEAMACGIPVFSTPVDGIIELVQPGVTGYLFEKNNSRQLAEILDYYARQELPWISAEACKKAVMPYEAQLAKEQFVCVIEDCLDKISVIIPCYNVADQVNRCLESIFAQKLEKAKLEIVCVDDRSTDETLQILMDWEARYPKQITVIALEVNGKQGHARNVALEYVSGNYVTYVDADDALAPGCLQELHEVMKKQDCDVAGCGYQLIYDEQRIHVPILDEDRIFDLENCVEDQKEYLLKCGWKTSPWGRLYRTDFLKFNHIVFAEGHYMEDILFSYLCFKYTRTYCHLAQERYLYYYNPNGTMASDKIRNYYLDTAIVQNMATDELLKSDRIKNCMAEYEYTYFQKAFEEPVIRMWENEAFFSYADYRYLRDEVKKRFPNMELNLYLRKVTGQETKLAFALYCANFKTEQELRKGLNY